MYTIPLRPDILSRPRILGQLDQSDIAPQLVLVSAPAGYGKTTLAREWIATRGAESTWYTLDSSTELRSFWTYLVYALQKVHNNLGRGTLEMLRSPSFFPENPTDNKALLIPLLNDLFHMDTPLCIVLDDYHLVEDSQIHDGLAYFIDNMPSHHLLVVVTRSDPPWPLARWRSKRQMLEVRQADLSFTRDETEMLLKKRLGHLDEAKIDNLYQKTEGWVTALHLVASSALRVDYENLINGDHRQILSYLTEEVLASQSGPVQDFLLKTSILSLLSPSLCDAVTGRNDSRELLNRLAKENLFLNPLDEQGSWYRYHPLFAELLYHYLETREAEQIVHLHTQAGNWLLTAGDWQKAIRHFLQAGDYQLAARVMDQCFEKLWEWEEMPQLFQWLNNLPGDVKAQFPRLLVFQALINLLQGNMDDAKALLNLVEKQHIDNEHRNELNGLLAMTRASYCIFTGELDRGLEQSEQALTLLPDNAYFWRISASIIYGDVKVFAADLEGAYAAFKNAYRWSKQYDNFMITISAAMNIQKILWLKGELLEARRFAEETLRLAKEKGFSSMPRVGVFWLFLGDLLREEGNLESAKRCVTRGISMCESEAMLAGVSHIFQVMVCLSMGRQQEAMKHFGRLEGMEREANLPAVVRNLFFAWKALLLLDKGDVFAARNVLQQANPESIDTIYFPGAIQLVLPRLLLAENRLDEARRRLEALQELPQYKTSRRLMISTLLVQTHLEELSGCKEAAEECLAQALRISKGTGFFQIFLDEGKEIGAVFSRLLVKPDYLLAEPGMEEVIQRICQRHPAGICLPDQDARGEHSVQASNIEHGYDFQELVEDLSSRELEILTLVSHGLSNKDISRRLNVSIRTVKWHNSNIFGKLGVNNRTQAVARARQLALLG